MAIQRQGHPCRRSTTTFFLFFSLVLLSAAFGRELMGHHHKHENEENNYPKFQTKEPSQRQLIGSSPPTCRYRCGGCFPCRPVHMAVHPGVSTPLDYYPEAWRCKCGSKLYMP